MRGHYLVGLCLSILTIFATESALAQAINLYEQPKTDSKTVGSIDPQQGVIVVFTPKEGGWVKVADPRNGNVGWIQSNNLSQVPAQVNVIQTGNQPYGFQVIQYGNAQPLSAEQMQQAMKQIKSRQEAAQQELQKMMKEIMNAFPVLWGNLPMIVPVVIVPEKGKETMSSPAVSAPSPTVPSATTSPAQPALQKDNKK